jgi:hypothetical protein
MAKKINLLIENDELRKQFSDIGAIAVIPQLYKHMTSLRDLVTTKYSPPSFGSACAPCNLNDFQLLINLYFFPGKYILHLSISSLIPP